MSRDEKIYVKWQKSFFSFNRGLCRLVVLVSMLLVFMPAAAVFARGGDPVSPFPVIDARAGLQYAKAMAVDSAGNIIVVGYTDSGSGDDYQVAKFKADGSGLAWPAVSFGHAGAGDDIATAVAVDSSGNIIVTGTVWNGANKEDLHTIKFNGETGVVIWKDTHVSGGRDTATAIAVDGSGDIYVAGYAFNGTRQDDFLILKYPSAGGAPAWVELYDDTELYEGTAYPDNDNRILSIAAGSDGIAVTGYSSKGGVDFDILTRKYGFDGTLVKSWRYSSAGSRDDRGIAVKMDSGGNVIVTGFVSNPSNNTDICTVKYDPNSVTPLWVQTYDGNANDEPKGMWVDGSGDVYVTGFSSTLAGNQDFFTVRYHGSDGAEVWKSLLDAGNGSTDIPVGIVVDNGADGGVFVTGYSTVTGNEDFLTVKYRKDNGALLWEKEWNGAGNKNDRPVGIALEPAGGLAPRNVIVAGWSDSATNGYDFAALKYDFGVLNVPGGLTAVVASNTSITLSWNDNSSNEDTFIIQRKLGESGTFADVITVPATLPANTSTYTDSGLAANNNYFYRVRSYSAAYGDSYYSNEAHALTKIVSYDMVGWKYIYNSADNRQDVATAITVGLDNHPVVTGFSDLTEEGVEASFSYDYMTFKLDRDDNSIKWKSRYDSGDGGTDMAAGLTLDSLGNVLVTGTAYLAGGGDKSDDLYTRKVATAGLNDPAAEAALLWDHQYGTLAGIDMATAIAMIRDGSNNSVVIGHGSNALNDDIFIIKYNNDGSLAWPPIIYNSGRHDIPSAVATDTAGNIFVSGYSFDTTADPNGSYDWFAAKYNGASGALVWSETYNVSSVVFKVANGNDLALSIDVDKAGNAFVTGYATSSAGNTVFYTVKFDGAAVPVGSRRIWEKHFNYSGFDADATAVKIDPVDGATVVAGSAYIDASDSDFHLIRYNPVDGAEIWNKNFDRPGPATKKYDFATAMTMDSSGYIYLAGNSRNGPDTDPGFDASSDLLSLVYDYEGTFLGAMNFDAAGRRDEASAITANYRGEAFIAGFATNASDNMDYVVLKQTNTFLLVPGPFTVTTQEDYTRMNLAWQVPPREIPPSFKIFRTPGPSHPTSVWTEIASPVAGTVIYTDTTVPLPGTSYCYTIEAISGSLNSRKTETCTTSRLQKPTLTLTVDSSTRISLNWDQIAGNTGYRIERKVGAGAWADLTTTPTGQNYYSDPPNPPAGNLLPGTSYSYRVSTISPAGYSLASNESSATTRPDAPNLNAPIDISNKQMYLVWSSVTGAASYTLEYKDGVGGTYVASGCPVNANLNCRVNLPVPVPPTPDHVYYFRVKATTATALDSDWSTPTSATATLAVPTWGTTTPTNITNNAMTLTWVYPAVTGAGPITYLLQYRTVPGSYADETTPSACSGTAGLSCNVTGLAAGTTYAFRVKAVNSTGSSAWISTEKTAVPVLGVPVWTAASNPSAITDSQMTVGWGAVFGATGYTLEVTPLGSIAYTLACPATSCTPVGLAANKTHFFRVQTNNGAAASSWTAGLFSGLTRLATPSLDSATATVASTTEIDLAWTASPDATGYSIEQADCKNSDSDPVSCNGTTDAYYNAWAVKATVGAVTATTITGLTGGTNYRYRITATVAGNTSAASAVRHAWTNITPPTLTITPGGTTSLLLEWNQQPGETLYDITKGPDVGSLAPFVTGQAKNIVTKTDSGLSGSGDFCYRIKAYSSAPNAPAPVFSAPACMKLPPAEPVISLSSTELESRYTVIQDATKNWNNGDVWLNQPVVISSGGTTYTRRISGGTSSSFFVAPSFATESVSVGDSYVILHAVILGKATGVDGNAPGKSLIDADKNWNSVREWQGSRIKILNSVNANNIGVERALTGNWNPIVYADSDFPSPIIAGDTYQIASFFGVATEAGTATQLIHSGSGWATNAWAGYYLMMTSGANNGHARKITANTTTNLITDDFPNASALGDTYLIAPVAKVGTYFGKAAGAGSTTTVLVNTDQWWGLDFTNYYLIMTSGSNTGQIRKIAGSTVTSITVSAAFEAAINPGDSYAVASTTQIGAYFGAAAGSSGYSKTDLVDTAHAWLTDWTQGYYLVMTSGSNNGYSRPITGRTGSTISVSPAFANNISPTDTYMIVQAAATSGSGKVSAPVAPGLNFNGNAKLALTNGSAVFSETSPGYGNDYNYELLSLKELSTLAGDFDLKFDYSTASLLADDGSLAYKYLATVYAAARFDFQSPPGKTYKTYLYRGRTPRQETGRATTYASATKTLTDTRTMPDSVTPWKAWSVDQWKDYYIQILSGPNNQLVRKVTANTANSLTLDNAFPYDPSGVSGNAAASGNSTTRLVDSTGTTNWSANIWVNYLLYMIDGPNAGKSIKIISNDSTSVTVEGTGFTSPIGSNDSYRIAGDSYRINAITGNAALGGSTQDGKNSTNSILVDSSDNVGTTLPPKNWSTDQWAGFYLYMSSGPNIGLFRTITGNTANSITVNPFPYQIASSDSYTIFDPRSEAQAIEAFWVQINDPVGNVNDFQFFPNSDLSGKLRFAKTGNSLTLSTSPAAVSWQLRRQLRLESGTTFVPNLYWIFQLGRLPHTAGTSESTTINNFQFTVPAAMPTTISPSYWAPEVGHVFRRLTLFGNPVEVSWSKIDAATLYQVERCESSNHQNPADRTVSATCVTFTQDQPTDGSSTVANLTSNAGLVAGYTYRFRVRARYNSTDFTAWSSALWLTITPPAPVMTAPAAAATTTTQLTPTWTNVNGDNGFKLYWKTSSDSTCSDGTWSVIAQAKDAVTYNHGSLSHGAIYCYYITANGPAGPPATSNSVGSNIVWQSTKPDPVTSITFSGISTSKIDLAWGAAPTTGISGYLIERKTGPAGAWGTLVANAPKFPQSYSDSAVVAGTQYFYRITALSNGGNSAVSAEYSSITTPVAPGSLALTVVSADEISLSWPVVAGATHYKIERSEGVTGSWVEIDVKAAAYQQLYCGEPYPMPSCGTLSNAMVSYADNIFSPRLKENTLYYYRLKSWNLTGGDSLPSTERYATTSALPKQNLIATALEGGFRIRLDWTPVECAGCNAPTGYEIQRMVRDGNWVLLKTIVGATTLTYTDVIAIDPGKQYRYRVRSLLNVTDASPYSEAMVYAKPYSPEANACSE